MGKHIGTRLQPITSWQGVLLNNLVEVCYEIKILRCYIPKWKVYVDILSLC